jgi:hypothetical protein
MRRSTLKYAFVTALAASALAASTATAKPVDRIDRYDSPTSSLAGTVSKQDLRGEHAQEAARLAEQPQDLRGEHARDAARFNGVPTRGTPAVYWAYDYEAPKPAPQPASAPAPKPNDDTDVWLVLGIALGTSAIVGASAVAFTRRSRIRVPA